MAASQFGHRGLVFHFPLSWLQESPYPRALPGREGPKGKRRWGGDHVLPTGGLSSAVTSPFIQMSGTCKDAHFGAHTHSPFFWVTVRSCYYLPAGRIIDILKGQILHNGEPWQTEFTRFTANNWISEIVTERTHFFFFFNEDSTCCTGRREGKVPGIESLLREIRDG